MTWLWQRVHKNVSRRTGNPVACDQGQCLIDIDRLSPGHDNWGNKMLGSNFGSGQPQQRTLVSGKLNVVGETHNESDLVRPAEMLFALAKTGSANYWTEAEFLDLYQPVGSRAGRGGQEQAEAAQADLLYRAAHCAALVIVA